MKKTFLDSILIFKNRESVPHLEPIDNNEPAKTKLCYDVMIHIRVFCANVVHCDGSFSDRKLQRKDKQKQNVIAKKQGSEEDKIGQKKERTIPLNRKSALHVSSTLSSVAQLNLFHYESRKILKRKT